MALPATDALAVANGTALPTYSASWTAMVGGGFTGVGGTRVQPGDPDSMALWNADTFNANQYAQAACRADSYQWVGPAVRLSGSGAGAQGYCVVRDNGNVSVSKRTGSSGTTLGASVTTPPP